MMTRIGERPAREAGAGGVCPRRVRRLATHELSPREVCHVTGRTVRGGGGEREHGS